MISVLRSLKANQLPSLHLHPLFPITFTCTLYSIPMKGCHDQRFFIKNVKANELPRPFKVQSFNWRTNGGQCDRQACKVNEKQG